MIARHSSHFILGGARSGKSRHAVALTRAARLPAAFVATAQPGDEDMRARIARHRAERPADWLTVEEPLALAGACRGLPRDVEIVLVDCLTLWVANRMLRRDADAAILAEADELTRLLAAGRRSWVIVSNEVGEGVHPETADGRRFRDLLGLVNQAVAAAADRVSLMVAGLPLGVKERRESAPGRERAPEAP